MSDPMETRLDLAVLRLMAAQIYAGYTVRNGTPEIGVSQRVRNCVEAAREILRQTEAPTEEETT